MFNAINLKPWEAGYRKPDRIQRSPLDTVMDSFVDPIPSRHSITLDYRDGGDEDNIEKRLVHFVRRNKISIINWSFCRSGILINFKTEFDRSIFRLLWVKIK